MKRRKSWRPWLDPVGLVARLLLAGTLVLVGLWTRAAVLGVLLTWWPSFPVPEDGSDWIATFAVGGLAIHLLQRGADRFSIDWALETPRDQPSVLRRPCTVDAQDDLV